MEMIAKLTPNQFLADNFSLNRMRPNNEDNMTIATLFTVKIVELSIDSWSNAFNR